MASLSPLDSRDVVLKVIKRSLFGPVGLDDTLWPGYERQPIVVRADQIFENWNTLNEALVNESGQEVLRFAPTRVYGIGVLFPKMTEADEDALAAEQEETIVDEAPGYDDAPKVNIPDPEPDSEPADESVQVSESGGRPRSIAISIHLPHQVDEIQAHFAGGVYKRIPVSINESSFELWERVPIEISLTLKTHQSAVQEVKIDGLTLNIGVDSKDFAHGQNLVTIYVVNTSESSGDVAGRCLYQSELSLQVSDLLPYPTASGQYTNQDDSVLELLYQKYPVRAVGHGTDAVVTDTPPGFEIRSQAVPVVNLPLITPDVCGSDGTPYAIGMLDLAEMNENATLGVQRIIADYALWLDERLAEVETLKHEDLKATARENLRACTRFYENIQTGWRLVQDVPEVERCLSWTSHVMNQQRIASDAPLRRTTMEKSRTQRLYKVEGSNPHTSGSALQSFWRPFQIAFVLASIAPAIDPDHVDRDQVDIIWMPTGGGKTEAYLGLAAFTMLWERTRRVATGGTLNPSVDVLMRYTLRLLTAQQVQRASALICAMEILRKAISGQLGDRPFRIGAYLGNASTPNRREQAVKIWNALDSNPRAERREGAFLLTRCPWCGAEMGVIENGVAGYQKVPTAKGQPRIAAYCPASDCEFSYVANSGKYSGLPVLEVDEDIYAQPPAFLVGTIDKFAQISWKSEARNLFGLRITNGEVRRQSPSPALFIQDELHLIAGPLGSLNAIYEVAIEALCEFDDGRRPRVLAATATTRNFAQQTQRLYGRERSRLIPPPALDVGDSFFARIDSTKSGKIFVAVCAPGFGSNVQSQLRTLAALNHAGGTLEAMDAVVDPWWTNLAFFSSRRSLGLQLSAASVGLERAAYSLSQLSGVRVGKMTDQGTRHARRTVTQVKELTATSRDNVTQLLAQLAIPKGDKNNIDLCFATSMIEVGIDVSRLGLMTVMGQPKSYGQYIQVTGRVGRSESAPGVVVVVLSPHAVRDRSHYETFTASHQRLYASVEPVSVTPFTSQALERGLGGAVAGILRATTDETDPSPLLTAETIDRVLTPWLQRATGDTDRRALQTLLNERDRLVTTAEAAVAGSAFLDWDLYSPKSTHPFLIPLGDTAADYLQPNWRIPTSMRSVDSECAVNIPRGLMVATRDQVTGHDTGEWEDF
ncbi:MAG: hypothetical protein JW384_02280 [Nitrosomonadaceae bacterium]|nr:hypothetical protein [Nitrosomonadaceae bacterium]